MKISLHEQIAAVKAAIYTTESPAMKAVLNTLEWLERNQEAITRKAGHPPETNNGLDAH